MKLSRQTREIINIVIFLVVVGLLLTFYVIYPLNRTKAIMGRTGLDDYDTDSIPPRPRLYGLVGAEIIEEVWNEREAQRNPQSGATPDGAVPTGR